MKSVRPSLLEAMLSWWCEETDPREESVLSLFLLSSLRWKMLPWACDLYLTLGSPSWRDRAELKEHSDGSPRSLGGGFLYTFCKLPMHVTVT